MILQLKCLCESRHRSDGFGVDDIILKKLLLVIQANQSGSSNAIELDGAKQCSQYLADKDVKVSSFQPNVQHYNDIWHVSKSLTKQHLKASKEKR